MTLGTPLPLKISQVERYEGQPRVYFNQRSLEELANSIQEVGQQQPIKVIKHPTRQGCYMIIDGERRWRAHKIIFDRTGVEPTILAYIEIVKDLNDHFEKSVVANLHREDLYPIDEAAALTQLKKNKTIKQISKIIGKSISYVDGYLKLDSLPDEIKIMMDPSLPRKERLSVTCAIDIARTTRDNKIRLDIARNVISKGLSLSDTRYMISQMDGNVKSAGSDGTIEAYHEHNSKKPNLELNKKQ